MGAPTAHSVVMQHSRRQAAPHAAPAVSAAAAAAAAAEEATAAAEAAEARRKMGRVRRAGLAAVELLDSTGVQLVLYVVFVLMFQLLAGAVRMPQEFYLDKHVMDRLVESHFDASHNRFATIRRVADVYEWGNVVLLPGLFADLGPCREEVGAEGGKACNDDTWPDGEGSFHLDGATPLGIEELVKRMDQFDWTDGLYLRQLGACYPELQRGSASREPFGYNWTHPSSPPRHPFEFFTQEQLGSNPSGLLSAAIPSLRDYDSDGFVALAIPFFSEVYLPHQEGTAEQVTDYRLYAVTPSNNRQARYYCVRVSHNGRHLKQLCDPGADGNGHQPYTGAVRATVEQWWNDLKRAHFLDAQSRVLTITLQLRSNNMGVGYRILLMLEFTSLGAILPSFNVETRLLDPEHEDRIIVYSGVALALVLLFSVNEIVEIVQNGIFNYFSDLWNVADWTNYFFFYVLYGQIMYTVGSASERDCSSYLCTSIGYYDDYKIMGAYRTTKLLLSICICIQLFKILKLFALLVPRMGLATAVLRKCVVDLLFFGVTFVISMLAFSNMLYIQLGPVMENYWDQLTAFMSLFRALFGDFDVEKIMDNSSGWFNTIVFLGYLFVAIFIMLSMFLAILAEAQVDVREDEKSIEEATNGAYKQYGIFEDIGELMSKHVIQPIRAQLIGEQAAAASAPAAEPEKSEKPPASANEQLFDAVRRLQETTQALQWSVEQSREQNRQLQAEVAALRYQSPAPKFSPAHLVTPPPPPSAGSPLGSLDVRRVRAANTLRVEGEPEDEEPVQSSVHFTYTV